MKKRGDSRKFLTFVLAVAMLGGSGGELAFAKDHHLTDTARPAAIHECNIEAVKYNPITQLSNQFAVYGTCMASHGQRFG